MSERAPSAKKTPEIFSEAKKNLRDIIIRLEQEEKKPKLKVTVRGKIVSGGSVDDEISRVENSLRILENGGTSSKDTKSDTDATPGVTEEKAESTDTERGTAIKVGVEHARKRMLETEAKYLSEYRKRVAGKKTARAVYGSASQGGNYLKQLKKEYDDARFEFSQKVNESVTERLNKKGRGIVQNTEDKTGEGKKITKATYEENPEYKEKVMQRYNRMVLNRDVIVRAEIERTMAKKEALDAKGKGIFKKIVSLYSRANEKSEKYFIKKLGNEKRGKIVARATRIAVFAIAGSAVGGAMEPGRYILRSGLSALFGTAAGSGAGKIYEKTLGVKRAKTLKEKQIKSASSVQDISMLEKAYRKGSKQGIEKERRLVEMTVAVLTGVGVSLETSHVMADYAVHGNENVMLASHHIGAVGSHDVVAHIDKTGEGADALFGDLKHKLRELYPDQAKAPPEAQHVLHTPLHKLSTEYGFADPSKNGVQQMHKSGLMHLGDKLEYDSSTGHLVFTQQHGASHVLASDASGHITKMESFEKFSGKYTNDVQHAHDTASSADISKHIGNAHALKEQTGALVHAHTVAHNTPNAHTAMPVSGHETVGGIISRTTERGKTVSSFSINDGELRNFAFNLEKNGDHISVAHTGIFIGSADHHLADKFMLKIGQPASGVRDVMRRAQEIEVSEHAISYLQGHNLGGSLEATILREHVKNFINETTKIYGKVFVDHVSNNGHIITDRMHDIGNHAQNAVQSHAHAVANNVTDTTAEIGKHAPKVAGSLHKEIAHLLQPDELGKYANKPVADVIYNSPQVSGELHKQLTNIVARSGVGPDNNETLAHFLNRAQDVAQTHGHVYEIGAHGVKVPVNEVHIYNNPNGDVVAYGGDYNARSFMAYNWLHLKHGGKVLFPDAGGNHMLTMTSFSSNGGRVGVSVRPMPGPVVQSVELSPK
ncbi:hypothetical protein MNBD_CPR01-490 [hydrothermal vent metagenome]|uniref:Uncharacterized protein n=1 Tax=hydrothermal vent metagenome TaxID=652676 RepID=A0A3B0ULK1_9ZZZZ